MFFSSPLPYLPDVTPYFTAIRSLPWAAWLDSGGMGRYDILVAAPLATLQTQAGQTEIRAVSGSRLSQEEPFRLVRRMLGNPVAPTGIPFAGGGLGFWSYDLGCLSASAPSSMKVGRAQWPQMMLGIYDWAVVVDHQAGTAHLVSWQRYAETARMLPQILQRLQSCATQTEHPQAFRVGGSIAANLAYPAYREVFGKVQQYLLEGDCYQVNLSRQYQAQASGDAFAAYLELRKTSPAPYSAFLDLPHMQVLSASPERFIRVQRGHVETRPIKGTRPRSNDAETDRRLAEDLRHHPKDRAENLMIVDLLRNDLGRSCIPGSVRVPQLFAVESYSHVHHLVSAVEGQLAARHDALDVLHDCFPGGSITGAPKKRAMEIIAQLEPHRRGIYCGAIGYVGFDGNMDTSIAIRTLVYHYEGNEMERRKGTIRCWAGGGLVADSRCDQEYQETLDKAAAMLAVLKKFGGELAQ